MDYNQIQRSICYYEWYTYTINKDTRDICIDKTSDKITEFLLDIYKTQSCQEGYKDYFVPTPQGEEVIIIDCIDETKISFRFALCRKNALPYIEKDGMIEELGKVISNDQNLVEVTHCVFFIKYGILGAEYNSNGVRATSVSEYMTKQSNTEILSSCKAKLNLDVYTKLIQNDTFTLFDFSVKTNSEAYNTVLANKSVFSALREIVPDSDTIEVCLRKRKTKKNNKMGFKLPLSFSEIKTLISDYRDDIKRFSVSQGGGKDAIDLMADKFVGKVLLAKTTNRTIDTKEMYREISNFFTKEVEEYCKKQEG